MDISILTPIIELRLMLVKTDKRPLVLVSACALLDGDGRVLIAKRPKGKSMAGLWEFPGGKFKQNESSEHCLHREINEELGVTIHIDEKLMVIKHSYTRFRVTLHVFLCRIRSGQISPSQCDEWGWVKTEELDNYPFPASNVKIIKNLINHQPRAVVT